MRVRRTFSIYMYGILRKTGDPDKSNLIKGENFKVTGNSKKNNSSGLLQLIDATALQLYKHMVCICLFLLLCAVPFVSIMITSERRSTQTHLLKRCTIYLLTAGRTFSRYW